MGINENALEDSLASIRTLEQDSPEWKVTYAGGWHPELNDLLDDYCVIVDQGVPPDEVRRRREVGRTTTFYVCCHPPCPNNFVFSPPAESAWMGWHAAALGYDGFLRWAYDSWTADPARDAPRLVAGRGLLPGLPGRPARRFLNDLTRRLFPR